MNLFPEIPTANGFCMYIKREAINNIGLSTKKLLEKATVKKMIFRTDVYKLDIDIYYVTTHTSIIKEPSHFLKKKQS